MRQTGGRTGPTWKYGSPMKQQDRNPRGHKEVTGLMELNRANRGNWESTGGMGATWPNRGNWKVQELMEQQGPNRANQVATGIVREPIWSNRANRGNWK
ncbi:hypothetical protein CWE04_06880 [Thomasclavelia cocleata]|nr:hypothetical protein CWE04_06880 [Thomasclavelia cocleata]